MPGAPDRHWGFTRPGSRSLRGPQTVPEDSPASVPGAPDRHWGYTRPGSDSLRGPQTFPEDSPASVPGAPDRHWGFTRPGSASLPGPQTFPEDSPASVPGAPDPSWGFTRPGSPRGSPSSPVFVSTACPAGVRPLLGPRPLLVLWSPSSLVACARVVLARFILFLSCVARSALFLASFHGVVLVRLVFLAPSFWPSRPRSLLVRANLPSPLNNSFTFSALSFTVLSSHLTVFTN